LALNFEGAPENPLIEAIEKLRALYRDALSRLPAGTDGSFAPLWQQLIQVPDRSRAFRAYEAAVLFELRKTLRNGSVWVSYSLSYRSRDQLLIPSTQWAEERKRFYRRLDVPMDPSEFLARFTPVLETGLEQLAKVVESGGIEIEKSELLVHKLEAEETSPQVDQTRQALFREIGHVQLPDLITEMDNHTRFSRMLLGREAGSEHELLTIYGALLAHGTEMTARGVALMIPGVSETAIAAAMHLLEDDQALRAANDASVEFMCRHAITSHWGEGAFASSDSMSLDATRHLYSARVDPRRRTPGIGIYTHKLDHWGLIYDQPVVLMQRQAGVAVEGTVRQQSSSDIERLAVDTHGFAYFAMATAKVLGFDRTRSDPHRLFDQKGWTQRQRCATVGKAPSGHAQFSAPTREAWYSKTTTYVSSTRSVFGI
jgi:hypothetical protein